MLKSFSVTNFKAFAEPITIDFSATGNYEFNKDAIKNNIAKTNVMYGKNASGKSSLGLAIFDIVATLTDNFVDIRNYINYKNLMTTNQNVSFEYIFEFNNTAVIYSYKKTDIKTIIAEKLIIGNKTVIEYDKSINKLKLDINFEDAKFFNIELSKLNFSALRFVRTNVLLRENKETDLFNSLYDFVNKMLLFWSLETREFIGYTPISGQLLIREIVKRGHFSDLQSFFKDAGFDEELVHKKINGTEQLFIKYNNGLKEFELASSSGMRSLLLFYFWLEDIAEPSKCPSFIFIDEFDAFYHFELSYFIIEKLKSYNCQVLLTTHNTSIFTNDLLRPDCYYICSKNKIENAHHSTLKEIRFGHNLEKLYRGGTFGK